MQLSLRLPPSSMSESILHSSTPSHPCCPRHAPGIYTGITAYSRLRTLKEAEDAIMYRGAIAVPINADG